MEKLLLAFVFLFCISQVMAQDYRFYAGIQGGPKVSFSSLVLPGQHDLNYKSYSKIRHQEGIIAGYNFKNKRMSVEGGYSLHRHGVTIDFWDNPNYGKTPDLWYDFSGDQVTLCSKMTLNNPESKVIFRAVIGGAYFMKWWTNKSNLGIFHYGDRYGFITYPYEEMPDKNFAFKPDQAFEFDQAPNIWLMQAGFEVQTNITKHIALNLSAIYQGSLKPVDVWSFKYSYNYDKGVLYEHELPGSAISKAEAINVNLGLIYLFSNRN